MEKMICRALLGISALAGITGAARAGALPPKPDMSPIVAAVDVNRDGRLTRAEWLARKLPMQPFVNLAKGRDFITAGDLAMSNIPADLDRNHDGKVTPAELIAYGRNRAAHPPKDRPPMP